MFTQLFISDTTFTVYITVLVQFLPSVQSPDTAIFFYKICFQSFNIVVQTWLFTPAAARPSGFAVIVVASNLLMSDGCLDSDWLLMDNRWKIAAPIKRIKKC